MAAVFERDSSDSEDEFFMFLAARGRRVKDVRPRIDNLNVWNDEQFFVRFRLTKRTVLHLLQLVEPRLETATDRNSSVSPIQQLLLALRFYATGCMLVTAGDVAGVHKSTASRIVKRVSLAIARLRPTHVRFPETTEERNNIRLGFYRKHRFPRVLGAIDCTHIRIQSPGGNIAETFRNRKGWFSLNVQTICDDKMRILDVVARWPGSAHDQTIFNNSAIQARLERGEFGDSLILGDSGYTVQSYLVTPLRNPQLPEEHLYNEAQIRTRGTVERQYGLWKRRFPVLSLGMRLALSSVQNVIVACAVLHNMAIEMNEPQPPTDPELPALDIEADQIPQVEAIGGGARGIQRGLVEYFRGLLH